MPSDPRPPLLSRLPGWLLVAIDTVLAGFMALGSLTVDEQQAGYGLPVVAGYLIALASTLLVRELAGGLIFSTGAVVLAGFLLGEAVSQQRRYAAALHGQATRNAVTQERLRIAREMHDVVAHQMSVIAVQAGVARLVMRSRPDEAFGSLVSIEQASRAGLGELRRLLSTLRADDAPGAAGDAANDEVDGALAPAPGLAEFDSLTSRAQAAGMAVTVQVRGTGIALPAGMELSAYRVVQEALTNVIKHAGDARATVVLDYRPDALGIEVTDDGRGPRRDGDGTGHGLIGMRERVAPRRPT